jgi:hypothetical protein
VAVVVLGLRGADVAAQRPDPVASGGERDRHVLDLEVDRAGPDDLASSTGAPTPVAARPDAAQPAVPAEAVHGAGRLGGRLTASGAALGRVQAAADGRQRGATAGTGGHDDHTSAASARVAGDRGKVRMARVLRGSQAPDQEVRHRRDAPRPRTGSRPSATRGHRRASKDARPRAARRRPREDPRPWNAPRLVACCPPRSGSACSPTSCSTVPRPVSTSRCSSRRSSAPAGSCDAPGERPTPSTPGCRSAALVLARVRRPASGSARRGPRRAGAAVLVGASLAAFSGLAVTRRSASVVTTMAAYAIGIVMTGPTKAAVAGKPDASALPRRAPAWVGPVVRGLALGLPLVAIFAVLFASADPIFRKAVDDRPGLPARPRRPARAGHLRERGRLVRGRVPDHRGRRDPGRRDRVAGRGRPGRPDAGRRGSSVRPRRSWSSSWSTSIVGGFVGLQLAYPLRRTRHDGGRRSHLRRLRPARLLRARRRGLPRRRRHRRARSQPAPSDAAVPRPGHRPGRADDRDAGLGGPATRPLPAGLRLDRAAAVRGGVDRRAGGDPDRASRPRWSRTGRAGWATRWSSSASSRSSP